MTDYYPRDEEARLRFWGRQLEYAKTFYEPYWGVSDRIEAQYMNQPTTTRETRIEDAYLDEEGRIKANILYAWVDQSIANTLDHDPVFSARPRGPFVTKTAPVVGRVVNYWQTETRQIEQDRGCLRDAFLGSYAVKRLGWSARLDNKRTVSVSDVSEYIIEDPEEENLFLASGMPTRVDGDQDHAEHIEVHRRIIDDETVPEEARDLTREHIREHETLWNMGQPDIDTTVQWEAPYGRRWLRRHFVMDPNAQEGLKDAAWIAFMIREPLYRVRANVNFKNTDNLSETSRPENAPVLEKSPMDIDDFGMVDRWEFWARDFPVSRNKRRNVFLTLVEGHDKFLRYEEEWPLGASLDDYPAEVLSFSRGTKTWIGMPIIYLAGGDNMQRLNGEYLDSMLSITRKTKNVWFHDPELLNDKRIDNVLSGPDGASYPVEGLSRMTGEPMRPLTFAQIPPDKQIIFGILTTMFDRVMGTPQPVRGQADETATEIAINERRNTAREDARERLFQEFQINTARKFWQLTTEMRPDRLFLIDPKAGQVAQVDEDTARGEYQFRIEIASRAMAKAVERKSMLDVYNMYLGSVQQFVALGVPPQEFIKPLLDLFARVLERGFDMEDAQQFVPGQIDKVVEAIAANPQQQAQIIGAVLQLSGKGGAMGMQAPGPANPQLYATNPSTGARQASEATRLEG